MYNVEPQLTQSLSLNNLFLYLYPNSIHGQLLSIRDELFETFRKRHKGVMEIEEVKLTSNSLHRLISDYDSHLHICVQYILLVENWII